MLLLSGFVIALSFSELFFKFRKTLLIAFLFATLNARNLLLQSSADVMCLSKSCLVVSQFLEWQAGRYKLPGCRTGEGTRSII